MIDNVQLFEEVTQVGIVVRDLKSALADYSERLGLGPWRIYRYAPPRLTEMRIRGQEIPYSMDTAICWSGKVMWELIEPLEGPTIYEEFLEAHGEGIHHVQVGHAGLDYDDHVRSFTERGCPVLMEGNFEGAKFAYFDTEGPLKTIIEIRGAPEDWTRPEPDWWYPAAP